MMVDPSLPHTPYPSFPDTTHSSLPHRLYTVALICPMGVELAPVEAMLDEVHQRPTDLTSTTSAYTFGQVAGHNVVVAVMPNTGNNLAAILATRIRHDLPSIRCGMLVGVGGGVPGHYADIRLGDVVVSQDVIQYDLGKKLTGGRFKTTAHPVKPPDLLMSHVHKLQGQFLREGYTLETHLDRMLKRYPTMRSKYSHPQEDDLLFCSSYVHKVGDDCAFCDRGKLVVRNTRDHSYPQIHIGTIGSANTLLRDAVVRDQLGTDFGVLCIDMEAAGMTASFPCLVIRGICDYADSHKNKGFQPYAAAMAAAYCMELLRVVPVEALSDGLAVEQKRTSSFKRRSYLNNAPEMDPSLFVGRDDDLLFMHTVLQPDDTSQNQNRVVLSGIGGIGKTQLAIRYAHQYSGSYDLVFWFDASSEAILNSQIQRTAHRVPQIGGKPARGEQKDLYAFLDWLAAVDTNSWLIIYDNYDDPELFDIKQYYPYTFHGSIIITTRSIDRVQGRARNIEPFDSAEQMLRILELRSRRSGVTEDPDARRLVRRLGGIPLALSTVGDYLGKSSWSFRDYLEEYEKQWKVDTRLAAHLLDYPNRTLYTTWNISYQRLKNEDPCAAQLLKLLGYLGSQNISHRLFKATSQYETEQQFRMLADRKYFESLMRALVSLGFVQVQPATMSYIVNVCIHDWMLSGLNENPDATLYWYAFDCLCSCIPDEMRPDHYLENAWLACHVEQLTKQVLLEEFWSAVSLDRCMAAADSVTALLSYTFQHAATTAILQKISPQMREELGAKSLQYLRLQRQLGASYRMEGKFASAENVLLEALPVAEAELGPNHAVTADLVNSLANLAHAQSQMTRAEELYVRAVELRKTVYGSGDRRTLLAQNNLGNVLLSQGRLKEAEHTLTEASTECRDSLGSETVTVVRLAEDLGRVYHVQRRPDDAEKALNHALALWETLVGADHPDTRQARVELGRFYLDTDKPNQAIDVLSRLSTDPNHMSGSDEVVFSDVTTLLSLARQRAQVTDDSVKEVKKSEILTFWILPRTSRRPGVRGGGGEPRNYQDPDTR